MSAADQVGRAINALVMKAGGPGSDGAQEIYEELARFVGYMVASSEKSAACNPARIGVLAAFERGKAEVTS